MNEFCVAVDFNRIPAWLADDLLESHEGNIDGVRWVTNGHIAFATTGEAPLFPGEIGTLLETSAVKTPLARIYPQAAVLRGDASNEDEPGGAVRDYVVPMSEGGIELALRYAAVIPYLFGDVEWYGSGSHDAVVAKVSGKLVAVVMPAPRKSERVRIQAVA
jgi:hypothetical protein